MYPNRINTISQYFCIKYCLSVFYTYFFQFAILKKKIADYPKFGRGFLVEY